MLKYIEIWSTKTYRRDTFPKWRPRSYNKKPGIFHHLLPSAKARKGNVIYATTLQTVSCSLSMWCCSDLTKNWNFTSKQTIHRFMCRDLDQSRPADWYKFMNHVSYPYQAKFVSHKHAKEKHETVETILNSTYMDDGIDSSYPTT